jgi:hypothetical protein
VAARALASEKTRGAAARKRLASADRLGAILETVPRYLLDAPRQEVNLALRDLFQAVVVSGVKIVELELRP